MDPPYNYNMLINKKKDGDNDSSNHKACPK
jgi:hypothetical protein